jgi:flagellar basal-body rod protein FlgF
MNETLSLVLASMHVDIARLDRVATNIANVQTPGYKREVLAAVPFAARVASADGTPAAPAGAGTPVTTHIDQRPGTLRATGQSLDLALSGPGWFEVSTDQGVAHTRQGNFRLDARGRLVTQQGHAVMGIAGEVQLLQAAPAIDAEGRVFEGTPSAPSKDAPPLAQLKIVQFEPAAPLERMADGLVKVRAQPLAAAEGMAQVQQGFLENSNVSQMHETLQLMQSVRHMETLQKVALAYDEMLATSIRRLGEGA